MRESNPRDVAEAIQSAYANKEHLKSNCVVSLRFMAGKSRRLSSVHFTHRWTYWTATTVGCEAQVAPGT